MAAYHKPFGLLAIKSAEGFDCENSIHLSHRIFEEWQEATCIRPLAHKSIIVNRLAAVTRRSGFGRLPAAKTRNGTTKMPLGPVSLSLTIRDICSRHPGENKLTLSLHNRDSWVKQHPRTDGGINTDNTFKSPWYR